MPLYLSPYIEAHKQAYYAALKEAQQRLHWQAMVGFLSDAVVGTVNELLATRTSLETLRKAWFARRRFRKGSASTRALDILPDYPVLTGRRLADQLQVTFPQAANAVGQLEEAGILVERIGYSRNRFFAASEVLTIVNRPFGERPALPDQDED